MKKSPTNLEMQKVYYKNQRNEMIDFIPSDSKRILDVGCSEGNFGECAKKYLNAEVWGIELSEPAARVAADKLDRVFSGDFFSVIGELPPNYFDCIVFNDVLEHFTDPDAVLYQCKNLLVPNGYIVSSIPNVRYIGNLVELIINKDWEYKSGGILDNTHYRFFTQKSILKMYRKSGYTVLINTGINPTRSFKTRLLAILTLGHMSDCKYLEFATVVRLS